MNNKGFTLVEMLAVVVILGIILGIATTSVLSAIETSKEESEKVFVDKIETAVESYINLNGMGMARKSGGSVYPFDKCKKFKDDKADSEECAEDATIGSSAFELEGFDLEEITKDSVDEYGNVVSTKFVDEEAMVNPRNKEKCLKNSGNPVVRVFKDKDMVYYYYVDLSSLDCDIAPENQIITNIPKKLCTAINGEGTSSVINMDYIRQFFASHSYFSLSGSISSVSSVNRITAHNVLGNGVNLSYRPSITNFRYIKGTKESGVGATLQTKNNKSSYSSSFRIDQNKGVFVLNSPIEYDLSKSTSMNKVINKYKYTCRSRTPLGQCDRIFEIRGIEKSSSGNIYSIKKGYSYNVVKRYVNFFDSEKYLTYKFDNDYSFCKNFHFNDDTGKYFLNGCDKINLDELYISSSSLKCDNNG